jgi:hypothetical protein
LERGEGMAKAVDPFRRITSIYKKEHSTFLALRNIFAPASEE